MLYLIDPFDTKLEVCPRRIVPLYGIPCGTYAVPIGSDSARGFAAAFDVDWGVGVTVRPDPDATCRPAVIFPARGPTAAGVYGAEKSSLMN